MEGGISGEIRIVPASLEQDSDIALWMQFATTENWQISQVNFDVAEQSLELKLPLLETPSNGKAHKPCLAVLVTIEVKQGVQLDHWKIDTANLDIIVEEGFSNRASQEHNTEDGGPQALRTANRTSINAAKGNLNVAYWSSRETRVELTSGSITGTSALKDLLYLKTTSGSISATVDPKEADPIRPVPADFQALTTSGTVTIHFPTSGPVPNRDYKTCVETKSASISGSYILGLSSSFHTKSGTTSLSILPYDPASYSSFLYSESTSGTLNLEVLPPHSSSGEDKSLSHLRWFHKSTSGTVNLVYPDDWEGSIDAETTSGTINLEGEDVHVGEVSGLLRRVIAERGDGDSRLDLRTASGDVNARIGR